MKTIQTKSVVIGFASYLGMVTIILPLVVEFTGRSEIVLNVLLVIIPLIAGFITAASAKESEITNGVALGLLIMLLGFFSFWLLSTQSRDFKHKIDMALILKLFLTCVSAIAGSAVRKYTKRSPT